MKSFLNNPALLIPCIVLGWTLAVVFVRWFFRRSKRKKLGDYADFRNKKIGKDCYIHGFTVTGRYAKGCNFYRPTIPVRFETKRKLKKQEYDKIISHLYIDGNTDFSEMEKQAKRVLPFSDIHVEKVWLFNPLKFKDSSVIRPNNSACIKEVIEKGFTGFQKSVYESKVELVDPHQNIGGKSEFLVDDDNGEDYRIYELTEKQAELLERMEKMEADGYKAEVMYCESEKSHEALKKFTDWLCEEVDLKEEDKHFVFAYVEQEEGDWLKKCLEEYRREPAPLGKAYTSGEAKVLENFQLAKAEVGSLDEEDQETFKVFVEKLANSFGVALEIEEQNENSGEFWELNKGEKEMVTAFRKAREELKTRIRWVLFPENLIDISRVKELEKGLGNLFIKKELEFAKDVKVCTFNDEMVFLSVSTGEDSSVGVKIPRGSAKLQDLMEWSKNKTSVQITTTLDIGISEKESKEEK